MIKVRYTRGSHGAYISYATSGSAGADVCSAHPNPVCLRPGERMAIPTGLCLELPVDIEAQVRPRSGLALNLGLTVLNAPGTIDPDYRGEISVILANLGNVDAVIEPGDRIAQLVFARFERAVFEDCTSKEVLSKTERDQGGFGSTGVRVKSCC